MRPGDSLELTIEKGVYRGLGLGRASGQVVFVPRALPGDRLRARIVAKERGYLRAEPEALLTPGPERRPSPCPFVPRCGGCSYQELDYPAQLRLKGAILRESLARAGAAWEGELPFHAAPERGWRMRATFHVSAAGGGLRVGLREEASRRVVDLGHCLQVSEAMNRAVGGFRVALGARPALAARVDDLILAEALDGSALVACLEGDLGASDVSALLALGEGLGLAALGAMVGPPRHRRYLSLRGEPYVSSIVLGVRLRAHVRSFFQGNRFLVEALARTVRDWTPSAGTLLDLYAGVGLFALTLAERAERVLGIESSPLAVEDAHANAAAAGFRHVRFREGEVRRALASWSVEADERIVLDPPRGGAGREVVEAVARRRPENIVYVSCDPTTLGRDLKAFGAAGYRVAAIEAFDLFPDTFHMESVVRLLPA
jgi:23S rRNA (uracil1939-C5)-methyltransferase